MDYHIIIVNQKEGTAKLWDKFVSRYEVAQLQKEALKSNPEALAVIECAKRYPDPIDATDKHWGAILREQHQARVGEGRRG